MAGNEEEGKHLIPRKGWLCIDCAAGMGMVLLQEINGACHGKCPECGRVTWLLPEGYFAEAPVLVASIDRKTKFYPEHRNAFGILPGPGCVNGTCPWSTDRKGGCFHVPEGRKNPVCYAYSLMKAYPSCRKTTTENTDRLRSLHSVDDMRTALDLMLDRFVSTTSKYVERHPDVGDALAFRWHWTGDVFSRDYARALSLCMADHPNVRFWTYTRSFDMVELLVADNLNLYLSIDDDNWEQGVAWFFRNNGHMRPTLRMAYMAKSMDAPKALLAKVADKPDRYFPKNPGAAVKWAAETRVSSCPVDLGKMETEYACMRCGQCMGKGGQLLFFQC